MPIIHPPVILIIDDEEDLCEILQFNLEGEGFSTDVAYSAEEALKKKLKSYLMILVQQKMVEVLVGLNVDKWFLNLIVLSLMKKLASLMAQLKQILDFILLKSRIETIRT